MTDRQLDEWLRAYVVMLVLVGEALLSGLVWAAVAWPLGVVVALAFVAADTTAYRHYQRTGRFWR